VVVRRERLGRGHDVTKYHEFDCIGSGWVGGLDGH
jgi:hypothetical protein